NKNGKSKKWSPCKCVIKIVSMSKTENPKYFIYFIIPLGTSIRICPSIIVHALIFLAPIEPLPKISIFISIPLLYTLLFTIIQSNIKINKLFKYYDKINKKVMNNERKNRFTYPYMLLRWRKRPEKYY